MEFKAKNLCASSLLIKGKIEARRGEGGRGGGGGIRWRTQGEGGM